VTALRAVPGTPLEEVRAALRALAAGIISPDLTKPLVAILDVAQAFASHPTYRSRPSRQAEAMTPGVLELARAINARSINCSCAPAGDPIAVANAAQEAL
jgi:hypothetical protein